MIRDIDISLLRAFAAVVDTGSVTAASRMLNRTQAAVSLQIKRLEEQLGQELFARKHRKLMLSPAGETLIGGAQRMLAANDALWGQMTTPAFEGEVRFGVPTDIVPTYLPPILRRFAQTWPRVHISLQLGNSLHLLEKLEHGVLDLALTTDTVKSRPCETLRIDKLVWTGAPGGSAHMETPLPIVVGDQSCRFRPVVLDALRSAGREWRMVLEVMSQVAQDATVSAGIAIGVNLFDCKPGYLDVLGPNAGLPTLPDFMINLHLPTAGAGAIATELARHIRMEFHQRYGVRRDGGQRTAAAKQIAPVAS